MPSVDFLRSNCQPDHSLLCFLSPLFFSLSSSPSLLASPFNIPSVVNHFCIAVRLLWLPYMVSMATEGVYVREHDPLMRTEPEVTYFPGTDGVLTVCTINQTPLWCLESRLGLAKKRETQSCIELNKTYRHSWTLSTYCEWG